MELAGREVARDVGDEAWPAGEFDGWFRVAASRPRSRHHMASGMLQASFRLDRLRKLV